MADENTEVTDLPENTPSENVPESTPTEAPAQEFSEVEKRAIAQGWVPQEQYQGNGKWRDAEEFLDRGELFGKIDEQNRRLKSQEMTLTELKKHYKSVRATEYKRALDALRAEKVEAYNLGDAERIVAIDEEIAETKQQQVEVERIAETQPVVEQPPNPAIVAWVNRNQWYNRDPVMKGAADAIADKHVANGERNPTRVLELVEAEIKKRFPTEFVNPNRSKAGAVEGGGNKGGSTRDTFQLTAEETQVMNKFVRAGVMTKDEYIADIKAARTGQGA